MVVGDVDTNGVSIAADSLSLNGGTLKDGSDNEADLDHRALGTQSRHKVDGIQPELAATRGAVVNGAALTLTYTETLDSASTPPSGAFFVSGGSSSRTVSDVALRGSAVDLTLSSAVAHWETGIRVSYTVPAGMGGDADPGPGRKRRGRTERRARDERVAGPDSADGHLSGDHVGSSGQP